MVEGEESVVIRWKVDVLIEVVEYERVVVGMKVRRDGVKDLVNIEFMVRVIFGYMVVIERYDRVVVWD